jgi:dolichol-phosphate mannosyltransferase
MDKARLVIFIPTYNEAENVEALFHQIRALQLDADFLFLDDNSPDGTGRIADRLAAEWPNVTVVHRPGKQGIGSAHRAGILWAYEHGYDFLLTMDCDFTHSPARIPEFLAHAGDYDIVIGSRYLQKGSLRTWNFLRRTLTRLGHLLTTTFLRLPYDATGAFRVYHLRRIPRGTFDLVYSQSYSFFFESLYVFWLNGFTIKELPLELPARTYGHSKMAFRDALHSSTLLVYLQLKTLIDRQSFLYAEEYQGSVGIPQTAARQEWDTYWLAKREPTALIYDLIAAFYRKFIIRRILNHFIYKHFAPDMHLLHAGCGSGQVDRDIGRHYAVYALDISSHALALYRKCQPRFVEILHGSIFAIPSADKTYDGIYNLGVMEHFTEDEIRVILKEFYRVLKPGGKVALFWPPSYGLTVRFLGFAHWVFRKLGKTNMKLHPDEITHVESRRQVRSYLEDCGFSLVDFYFGSRDLFTHAVIVGQKIYGDNLSPLSESAQRGHLSMQS